MLGVERDTDVKRTQFGPVDRSLLGVIEGLTRDPKLERLFGLIRRTEFNPIRNLELSVANGRNIYLLGIIGNDSQELARQYFENGSVLDNSARQERVAPYLAEVLYGSSSPPSLSVDFLKTFEDDGTIQFAAFGSDWESQPGNTWVMYGHIVSERRS